MQVDQPHSPPARTPSHSSSVRPRGILKNSRSSSSNVPTSSSPPTARTQAGQDGQHHPGQLAWDETNLSLNDLQRDSTMKITEPKTPYVRYNAETDEVMDLDQIPGFSLGSTSFASSSGGGGPSNPTSPTSSTFVGAGAANATGSSRRGSEASEKMVRVERSNSDVSGGEEAFNESDDEEADEETIEHRRAFAQKRGRHYSNEGMAMKQAAALLAQEDDDDEDESEEARVEANTERNTSGMSAVPPVPPLPNGLQRDAL
ncbi:hypothetical protein NBRC10512_003384 [Rhodotorula toruloides]|uniref:RHTO0S14e02256g1_1 n=2 Tax=Rhodotorula toruloides TaxID=5286 RepID=A0A061BBJ8_RHOTO|nr:protein phosphatase inhibitor 2 [Rhodotorula toruloides NP11]EMS24806.1 protein phosphatase inhibitor 2 [Rhodotorula toruloides NP11]KAJ8297262.1 Protein phosphatase inhibitor 2 [Rhodotorula toruloides]CDR47333.1 RHTO0S14e02256g1_1 [Rhodotorula toruloides]